MTKSEFQELQSRAATCGTTLKAFLQTEGVAYSTYNYWSNKIKAEADVPPMAPISIRNETEPARVAMDAIEMRGVTLAFPNGVRAHFGRGSERVLMEVLSQSMS